MFVMTTLWLALAALFLELADPTRRDEFMRRYIQPVQVTVRPAKPPVESIKLRQIYDIATGAIRTKSTLDDKYALAMIEHISKGQKQ